MDTKVYPQVYTKGSDFPTGNGKFFCEMLPKYSNIDYNRGMKNEEQNHENQSFMREKVVRRGTFKKKVLWVIRTVFGAALFGLVACFVFVWSKPWMEERIHPEPESTTEPIILPWADETAVEALLSLEATGEPEGSAAAEEPGSEEPGSADESGSEEPGSADESGSGEPEGSAEAGNEEAGSSGESGGENPGGAESGSEEPGNEESEEPGSENPGESENPGGESLGGSGALENAGEGVLVSRELLSLEKWVLGIVETRVQSLLDEWNFTLDDYKRLNGFLSLVINQANHGIVRLTAENTEEISEELRAWEASGALFLITEKEGLILMDCSRAEDCATFQVRFYNGAIGRGSLKAADRRTGLAVVSVSRELLDQAQILETDTLALGSSYTASLGQTVVTVGNPYGAVYSAASGRLVYLPASKAGIDNERRMLCADISAAEGGGFLINLDGEILGLTTENTREETEAGYRNFLAVTDLRPTIERLANGREASYLGVTGTAVTRERTEEYGTPPGLYLTDVAAGSPAYNSGIQSGDVLLSLNEVPVSLMKDVQTFLATVDPGQEVEVRLCRQGKDEYVELIYTVVIGAR